MRRGWTHIVHYTSVGVMLSYLHYAPTPLLRFIVGLQYASPRLWIQLPAFFRQPRTNLFDSDSVGS